ncbi:sensor histidine kinase [Solidesulfovibrio magneticus]|uniref:histidine kinase n=1 Tax=Solidesulfovibrio magneticus (strain ATCC 700980 / DSM 13731 / RS-1) TaxID=573370 RepID=C4XHB3_SOLM1|nr:ATP-binding protein [Solidesulfovibrio magneticus]BAH73881.1 sensor histidine kinase [Solidesulfovibrio magneticus RS-1]
MSLRDVLPRCGDWAWLAPALPLAPLAPLALCLVLLDSQARTPGVWLAVFLGGAAAVGATLLAGRRDAQLAAAERESMVLAEQVLRLGKLAAIGEMAAGLAHEINNPVAIMMEEAGLGGDILADGAVPGAEDLAELRRALGQIETQGARCKEITHMVLAFARTPDGRGDAVDVSALVEEMAGLTAKRADYAKVQLATRLAPNLPPAACSASQLQQLLLNLINNALDAMEPDGGELTLETTREGGRLVLTVSDTGPGIPQAVADRVFEPFFTTKAAGKGTGLGLSICAGIVRQLGGDIAVSSTPGRGATFRVSLPVAHAR